MTGNETDLVSPVSFLKEKPRRAIFFPVTVLKRQSIILQANRRRWYSFISITWTEERLRTERLQREFRLFAWWRSKGSPAASTRPPRAG